MRKGVLILFVFLCSSAFCQEIKVRGILQSEQDASRVNSAVLYLNNTVVNADTTGIFYISLKAGSAYQLDIKAVGFADLKTTVSATKDTDVVFFMVPSVRRLKEVTVTAEKENQFGISRLNNVEGTTIYAGKKSEAVYVQDLNANLATNNSRQLFSKVPGINVFENDGSGSTIGVGGRGLDPNRITNFNTRQNGYDISADALGYPESYYTPPTEAIERIEILRGAAALQFGTQFGGMINYRFTEAPVDKKISGDFRQTLGSFGLFNSFNRLSGTVDKVSYNTFYQYKTFQGWRPRTEFKSHNFFTALGFKVSEKLSVRAEFTFLDYLAQQPGGLTDAQFYKDRTQVNRQRNWFAVRWNLASVSADYKFSDRTRISLIGFGLLAGRDALGVLTPAHRGEDTSANRNLLQDVYRNYGSELRWLHRYKLLENNSHLLIGARYYKGHTSRKQGDASNGFDADFRFLNPDSLENSAYEFPSTNVAVFVENIFQLTKKWAVTPGLRFENISTASEGYYSLSNRDGTGASIYDNIIADNRESKRHFLLGGIGTQFKITERVELYANISQNYRSINFNDMRIENPNFQVDPNLKDENGYTTDLGFRGSLKDLLYFDISAFMISYNDRIGTVLRLDSATYQLVRYRTNVHDSRNTGVEAFAELDWLKLVKKNSKQRLSTFVNLSLIHAVYVGDKKEKYLKKVEFAPAVIIRTGLTYAFKKLSFTCQHSYTSNQFSEATNAPTSPTGTYGEIPAYHVTDLSAVYSWKYFKLSAGVNNLGDSYYFTRRAEGYPGPGIIPADPRNFYVTANLRF